MYMYVHACMSLTHTRANVCLHYGMSIGDHKVATQRTWLCTVDIGNPTFSCFTTIMCILSLSSLQTDNYIEVVTSPDHSQRGAQLSILFPCPVEKVSKAIQAKGAAVSVNNLHVLLILKLDTCSHSMYIAH